MSALIIGKAPHMGVVEDVLIWTVFFLIFCIPGLAFAGQDNWVRVSDRIERALHEALKSYSAGRIEEAMEKVVDA